MRSALEEALNSTGSVTIWNSTEQENSKIPRLMNSPDIFPLKGRVFDEKGYLEDPLVTWRCNGRFRYSEDDWDIIGMWEEPKISIEDLPKPFKPKDGESYYSFTCCFRTKRDAQKWVDFMKSMME